jgi:hypothetical protein
MPTDSTVHDLQPHEVKGIPAPRTSRGDVGGSTRSRCATRVQNSQRNVRPLGLATVARHRGQVELVLRSSTSSTSMPASAALSVEAAIICPGFQLFTARFWRLPASSLVGFDPTKPCSADLMVPRQETKSPVADIRSLDRTRTAGPDRRRDTASSQLARVGPGPRPDGCELVPGFASEPARDQCARSTSGWGMPTANTAVLHSPAGVWAFSSSSWSDRSLGEASGRSPQSR